MKYPIDLNAIPAKIKYYSEVIEMNKKASDYLLSFDWCVEIKSSSIYLNLGSILCIFLFQIENSASSDDNCLWVIVGDLPSVYLDIHGPKTTVEVLEDYTNLADDWTEHIKNGKSIDDCYPFGAEQTVELAMMLEKRSSFIKNTIIHNIDEVALILK
jgi:hypothetical protein